MTYVSIARALGGAPNEHHGHGSQDVGGEGTPLSTVFEYCVSTV